MNIFLDTSILYPDPFWKKNFFEGFKNIVVKDKKINVFISNIVLLELQHNYRKILQEQISKLSVINDKINDYNIVVSAKASIDVEESVKRFDAFYRKLIEEKTVTILDYSNDFLPEILDRAITRKKPFTKNKTELKDCVIWLTYFKYAEDHKLNDCILLTNNTSDFCDSKKTEEDNFSVHPELQKDSKRFRIYASLKELIQKEWGKEQNFDEDFVLNLIMDNFTNAITKKIEQEYERLEPYDIVVDDEFVLGYVSPECFEIFEVDNIVVNVFDGKHMISGEVLVGVEINIYEYNSVRDPGEDSHRFYREDNNIVKLTFSFYCEKNETPRGLNLDDFEIESRS